MSLRHYWVSPVRSWRYVCYLTSLYLVLSGRHYLFSKQRMKCDRLLATLNIVAAEVRALRLYALLQCAILVILVCFMSLILLYRSM